MPSLVVTSLSPGAMAVSGTHRSLRNRQRLNETRAEVQASLDLPGRAQWEQRRGDTKL